jgi:uncharacterized protein
VKFLIVLLVVLVGVFIWRSNRRSERVERNERAARTASRPTPSKPPQLEDMVSCPVCALHLPAADAVPGRSGALYCSAGHRQQVEG